eukprot:Em0008g772a
MATVNGIDSDVCEGGVNDGESDGDNGDGESDDGGSDSDMGVMVIAEATVMVMVRMMNAFCAVIGTSYRTLKHWMQQVCSDSDVEPHPHGNSGRAPHHALSREDKRMVVRFIENYAAINAHPDPGQLQGTIRGYCLESGKTLKSVYAEYCNAMESISTTTPAPQLPCPYRLTSGLKRQYTLLNVPLAPPTPPAARVVKYVSFMTKMLVTLRHSLSDEQRKTIIDKYNQHLIKAKTFRDAYNANIEDAEKGWGRKDPGSLGIQITASRCHCPTAHSKGAYFISEHLTRCLVCVVSHCATRCSDEAEQAGKGAVVVFSLVHAFFHLHGLGERRVTLQIDNCVGQNKNTTMLWYLAWRVITGQHDTVQLNFMLPGHTKFQTDSYVGLFKKYYRRQDHVDNMDDLADCVWQCGQDVICVPQLYQDWHI